MATDFEHPHLSHARISADDIRSLIEKLRWLGADDEAEKFAQALAAHGRHGVCLLQPVETD